jgi:hypothetical protein
MSRSLLVGRFTLVLVMVAASGCRVEVRDNPPPRRAVYVEERNPPPQTTYEEQPGGEVIVESEPPPPRNEVIVYESRPSHDHIWIAGNWSWHGRWVWTNGHWERSPHGPGYHWQSGVWTNRGGHWHWTVGVWVRG